MLLVDSVNKFINRGEGRSVQIKKNILISFLIKGLSVVINFLIVPITIGYVDQVRYGIWVTLTSIITWFAFFDFGMGNGLRNKLTTALAHMEYDKAQKYISTSYAVLTLMALSFFGLFCVFNPYINWGSVLNIPTNVDENIHLVMLIVMGAFCLQFTLQLLNTILRSMQEPAKAELLTFFGQLMILVILVIIKNTVTGSLSVLVLALNVAPVAVLFAASLLLYNGKLRSIAPSFKKINFSYAKSILNIGGVFFLIQIGSLVLHQTDNIIITRIIGPEAVTKFNVTYKLYSVIIVAFLIIASPYWSAFTDAFAKKDYQWITKSVKRLRKVWVFTSFVVVPLFFVLAKFLFKILFPSIHINSSLSISMAVYVICYTWLSLNCYFLYGTGKLRILLILYLFVTVTNVPFAIVMGKWWGIEGVIMANVLSFVLMNIVLWIQTNKILQLKASGIWNS
ncbi:MAG TPA: oligosaccharide flippase family protein [Chitinophagaceae bacterium]|jgi:O-antigen/teichoic acid export membrane protein|nr:oligosaccharide flippase family protein [Chitinophagaceae bacterium]